MFIGVLCYNQRVKKVLAHPIDPNQIQPMMEVEMTAKYLNIPALTEQQTRNFWNKVQILDPDSCWEWQAHRDRDGYGSVKLSRKTYRATRVAYSLEFGDLRNDLGVLHKCDNPPCCNPNHLFLGTVLENNRDAKAKGRTATGLRNGKYTKPERTARGERVNTARLTETTVYEIIAKLRQNVSQQVLATEHNICRQAIWAIAHGKTWKHIER
jgi:hypothetical protein